MKGIDSMREEILRQQIRYKRKAIVVKICNILLNVIIVAFALASPALVAYQSNTDINTLLIVIMVAISGAAGTFKSIFRFPDMYKNYIETLIAINDVYYDFQMKSAAFCRETNHENNDQADELLIQTKAELEKAKTSYYKKEIKIMDEVESSIDKIYEQNKIKISE